MGIDINCTSCNFQGKQCFSSRRELLDALRKYLVAKRQTHRVELDYVNWIYREEEEDEHRLEYISEEKKIEARKLLREKELEGLFFYISLEEEDHISYLNARDFAKTYSKIRPYLNKDITDLYVLRHAVCEKHNLECW